MSSDHQRLGICEERDLTFAVAFSNSKVTQRSGGCCQSRWVFSGVPVGCWQSVTIGDRQCKLHSGVKDSPSGVWSLRSHSDSPIAGLMENSALTLLPASAPARGSKELTQSKSCPLSLEAAGISEGPSAGRAGLCLEACSESVFSLGSSYHLVGRGWVLPPGDISFMGGYLGVAMMWGEELLASSGWSPGMPLNVLRCTGQPPTVN